MNKKNRVSPLSWTEIAQVNSHVDLMYARVMELLDAKLHPTRFCTSGWGKKSRVENELWVSEERWTVLDNSVSFNDAAYERLEQYHANPELRDSILAILELKKEASHEQVLL